MEFYFVASSVSDLYLIIRVPDSTLMDIRRAHTIINDYTIAFFDQYLNGVSERLVDGQTHSPYEDVTVASRNVRQQLAHATPD